MTERLAPPRSSLALRMQKLLSRAVALLLGGVLLIAGFVFSMAMFAVALLVVLGVFAFLMWKTRHVRRQMREQMRGQGPVPGRGSQRQGEVIEGTVIRSSDDSP